MDRQPGSEVKGAALSHFALHRSEEHTSELQSQSNLVCRLLLEKKTKLETRPVLDLAVTHAAAFPRAGQQNLLRGPPRSRRGAGWCRRADHARLIAPEWVAALAC